MKVLVTGGTGLVGKNLQELKPEYIYLGSKDCDLLDYNKTFEIIKQYSPDIVIHLAGNVGGLFKNMNGNLQLYLDNMDINRNVLRAAHENKVQRLICCLSTCIFPDDHGKILESDDLHKGPPHGSNYGYAYAKRMMEVLCRLYNETYGYNYQCIVPTNIYGKYDNFNLDAAHVMPALIHKAYIQTQQKSDTLYIRGTGKPLRQFIYAPDICRMIVEILENPEYINKKIILCTDPNEVSIYDISRIIANNFQLDKVESIDNIDGQYKKTTDTDFKDFKFTKIEDGLKDTIDWFKNNYDLVRK